MKIFWIYWRRAGSSARAGRAEGSAGQPSVYAGRAQPAPAPNWQGASEVRKYRFTEIGTLPCQSQYRPFTCRDISSCESRSGKLICAFDGNSGSLRFCPLLHLHLQNCKPRVFTVGIFSTLIPPFNCALPPYFQVPRVNKMERLRVLRLFLVISRRNIISVENRNLLIKHPKNRNVKSLCHY